MKSPTQTRQFSSLLSRLVSRQLAPGDAKKIEDFLRTGKAARDYYRHYLAVHMDLEEHIQEQAALPFPSLASPARPMRLLALAALIPLALGLGIWWTTVRTPTDLNAPLVAVSEPSPVLAVTGYHADLRWNLPEPPSSGIKITRKPITLEQGTLVLHLVGSQSLTLRGPVQFELLNDKEMRVDRGDAALRMVNGFQSYLVHVPGGAVADLGTEFSVKVPTHGPAHVRVFEGKVIATSTDDGNRTRYERQLDVGESAIINETLDDSPLSPADFLRPHLEAAKATSPAGVDYTLAVKTSAPVAWWRFEEVSQNQILATTANTPHLVLNGAPQVIGAPGHRFLYMDAETNAGYATPASGIKGLDTRKGMSLECLIYPESEKHMTAILLEDLTLKIPIDYKYRPQRGLIERAGRTGALIGHSHPPYAIRGLIRAPSRYWNGVNAYTSESYLERRWIHVVQTYDGKTMRLFVDGQLANAGDEEYPPRGSILSPVIGSLRAEQGANMRQWVGGIDEVALYNRVLKPTEVQAHFSALEK